MSVYFQPWEGRNYGKESVFGLPIMILGESLYEWEDGVSTPDRTKILVGENATGEWSHRQFTILCKTFMGEEISIETKNAFWNSVAYYNFIQEMVGGKARKRPTWQMWQDAAKPFFEILQKLQPACLLVAGKNLWDNLPKPMKTGPNLRIDNEIMETRYYATHGANMILAGYINHPASFGFKKDYWRLWVTSLIETAKKTPCLR